MFIPERIILNSKKCRDISKWEKEYNENEKGKGMKWLRNKMPLGKLTEIKNRLSKVLYLG